MAKIISNKPKNPLVFAFTMLVFVLLALTISVLLLFRQKERTVTNKKELLALKQDLINLDQILTDRKAYEVQLTKIYASLPGTPEEVSQVLSQFELFAKNDGLSYDAKLADTAMVESGGVQSIKTTITLNGSYTGIKTWLGNVATLASHTAVDSIIAEQGKGAVQATVVMRLFVQ